MSSLKKNLPTWHLRSELVIWALGAAALFVGLAAIIYLEPLLPVDIGLSQSVQEAINASRLASLIKAGLFGVSFFGYAAGSIAVVASILFLFIGYHYHREAGFAVLAASVAGLGSLLLKILIHRARPSRELVTIFDFQTTGSFPSGHVVFYTVFFGFVLLALVSTPKIPRRLRQFLAGFCGFLILTVWLSRIYLGAHWLSDVIGGYLLGGLFLLVLAFFYLEPHKQPRVMELVLLFLECLLNIFSGLGQKSDRIVLAQGMASDKVNKR